jgi:ABC-type nitrate/sulfonate/bicarbonate transport system substrate-binding protein
VVVAIGIAACGDGEGELGASPDAAPGARTVLAEPTDATLVLDFIPNAVHAGIYTALADGCYADRNLNLEIIEPTSTADTLKLIDAGKAEFGIADGSDVAGQIDAGRGAKTIMAIVQRPQGQLITLAESGIAGPAELEGGTVGVSGVPSDTAVLETIVRDAGGDPDQIEVVTLGFNGVQALENERVDGLVGFAADAVQADLDGFPTRAFPLDEFGGPAYPGLVIFSTEETIAGAPELMSAFVECTVAGYEATLDDPDASIAHLLGAAPALDPDLVAAQLDLYEPQFGGEASQLGAVEPEAVEALSDFLIANGLADAPIAPGRYGTNEFLPGGGPAE